MIRFLPIISLIACAGTSSEDTGVGTGDSGDSADTMTFPFTVSFYDGLSGAPISGAEVCTVFPETDTPCVTTDSMGTTDWSWETSGFTNVLNRMTHANYMTTLYAGRYEQDVHDGWMETLETSDSIALEYWAYQPSNVEAYLATGNVVQEDGKGGILYWLLGADGSSVDGAVITLENDSGESVGEVRYGAGMTNTLNPDLTATSIAGLVVIANVTPGEYTLRVTHNTLTCEPGFAYASGVLNTTTVPAEADSQTLGNFYCYTQ